MFDKLVRMQHFGLPTRLLDVSRNAMVALFFATDPGPVNSKPSDGLVTAFAIPPELEKYYDSDSVSCIANLANMTAEEKGKIFQLKESLPDCSVYLESLIHSLTVPNGSPPIRM
jgi:hypothetical protein